MLAARVDEPSWRVKREIMQGVMRSAGTGGSSTPAAAWDALTPAGRQATEVTDGRTANTGEPDVPRRRRTATSFAARLHPLDVDMER
jgi:hypothetical protein